MYSAKKERYNNMKYNNFGDSGLKVSEVSLGLWHNFGTNDNYEKMKEMIFTAFDNGITMFDLANNYGPLPGSAETNFGKILNEDFISYRDEILISTKAGYTMWEGPYGDYACRKYLISSLDQSLKRMGIDYVDIFYSHRMDKRTPLEETMLALDTAVKSGKALYAGISNYDSETTERAADILNDLKCPFIVNQVRYSMFDRHIENDNLFETAKKRGKGLIIFSPLEQGLLTDKYLHGIPDDSRMAKSIFLSKNVLTTELKNKIISLNKIARERNQTLAEMALSWVLIKKEVSSVIIGASSKEQIFDNIKINKLFSETELKEIDKICLSV